MSTPGRLSTKQQAAISALLSAPSIEKAAVACGCTRQSIHRWLRNNEAFKAALWEARRAALSTAIRNIQKLSAEAVEVLSAVMLGEKERTYDRTLAARSLLEFALRHIPALKEEPTEGDPAKTRIQWADDADWQEADEREATRSPVGEREGPPPDPPRSSFRPTAELALESVEVPFTRRGM